MRDVYVKAMKAFNNHEVGDLFYIPMTEATAHLIVDHYLELMWDPAWEVGYGASGHVPPAAEEREQEEG